MSRQDALTKALIEIVKNSEDQFEAKAYEVANFKSPRMYGGIAGATVGGLLGGPTGVNLGQTVGQELGGLVGGENPASQQVKMIELQQLGQTMNTVTTAATNIIKSNGESQRAIAQNLRS